MNKQEHHIIIDLVDMSDRLFVSTIDGSCHVTSKKNKLYIEKNQESIKMKIGDILHIHNDHITWTPKILDQTKETLIEGVDFNVEFNRLSSRGYDY
jgi:hypothetical protein